MLPDPEREIQPFLRFAELSDSSARFVQRLRIQRNTNRPVGPQEV